jgi:hypothetical protein
MTDTSGGQCSAFIGIITIVYQVLRLLDRVSLDQQMNAGT